MRWIRLVIGLFLQQTIQFHNFYWVLWLHSSCFHSIFNTGCGLNGCKVATFKKSKMNSREYHKSEKPGISWFFYLVRTKVLGPILKVKEEFRWIWIIKLTLIKPASGFPISSSRCTHDLISKRKTIVETIWGRKTLHKKYWKEK
jgi:hypothetical protein